MNAKTLLLGTLFGALTLFAWDTVSNTVIPWHAPTMKAFKDSNAIVQAVKANAPTNGMYVESRGVVAAVSFLPDMGNKTALLGLMLTRHFVLDVVAALILVLAVFRLPRATNRQYAFAAAAAALAVSLSIEVSYWNWYGFGASWAMVNIIEKTIGFALLGLVVGACVNKWARPRATDEWSGVKAPSGLPSSVGAPVRK